MRYVVDTNVPVAANGRSTHADVNCQFVCVEFLQGLMNDGVAVLDTEDLLIEEYRSYLSFSGQPGIGDVFYKFLHDNKYIDSGKVVSVVITPIDDDSRGFDELPSNELDASDRKFLAAAVVADGVIVNALDTDWHQQQALLEELSVSLQQLCPQHGRLVR